MVRLQALEKEKQTNLEVNLEQVNLEEINLEVNLEINLTENRLNKKIHMN